MVLVVALDVLINLLGQPKSYWNDPHTAMRGDGLSIYHSTNHMFVFFMGSGWWVFLLATTTYLTILYFLTAFLPAKPALFILSSVIFAHYFDTSNWLAVHWLLGFQGPFFYGLGIGAGFAQTSYSFFQKGAGVKNLRWIAIMVIIADAACTLYGQPHGYWQNYAMVDEGNPASKFF